MVDEDALLEVKAFESKIVGVDDVLERCVGAINGVTNQRY